MSMSYDGHFYELSGISFKRDKQMTRNGDTLTNNGMDSQLQHSKWALYLIWFMSQKVHYYMYSLQQGWQRTRLQETHKLKSLAQNVYTNFLNVLGCDVLHLSLTVTVQWEEVHRYFRLSHHSFTYFLGVALVDKKYRLIKITYYQRESLLKNR